MRAQICLLRRDSVREITFLLILSLLWVSPAIAQSPTATINGIVLDPSGAAIVGAQIVVVSDATGVQYTTKANGEGIYVVPNLPPGPYRIQVSNSGFKTIIKSGIVIHVQDALAINFTLPVGAASEIVTVEAGGSPINTQSAAVSTVVDHRYVENMPLNGRSLQDLILLTPGVVTTSPQAGATLGADGEFSVNGQRTEANNYSVDGVSANIGVFPIDVQGGGPSGSLPAATALGTTQGLVSVDALEEFRVQTSTYSAEYGRNPGGQFSFVTRSGTNQWHGTAFDYLRNNIFDANNWFNNFYGLSGPALRQNDFGGTLGGRGRIPRLYNGENRTFFFFSYEGLRLVQPQAASVSYVPTVALRQSTPTPLQSVMNAFPVPNCPPASSTCLNDLGNGLGQFIGTWSNPSHIDTVSVRLDQVVNDKFRLFFRFSGAGSSASARRTGLFADPANVALTEYTTRTYTGGATNIFSSRVSNEFRINYSSNRGTNRYEIDSFAGGQTVDLMQLEGISQTQNGSPYLGVLLYFRGYYPAIYQRDLSGLQKQWNVVDKLSVGLGHHVFTLGFDDRRSALSQVRESPQVYYYYFDASSVSANSAAFVTAANQAPAYPVYINFSAFAQDDWRLIPRLTVSLGLRWEVNPAPGVSQGNPPYTVRGSSLSNIALAPQGTPLWNTTWFNFAPRLGAAYLLHDTPGHEMVVRGGAGVFFDTGQQLGSFGYLGPGFAASEFTTGSPFPLPAGQVNPPIVNPPVTPYGTVYGFPEHLQLPYTLQWNASVQQAFGTSQALTVSYVGANGRRLLERNETTAGPLNSNFGTLVSIQNGLTSDYSALQVQFQRRLSRALQALASYTWSHSIDYGSSNGAYPYKRGNSDFDVRHNLSGAASFDMPNAFHNRIARATLGHWSLDGRLTARTGFPVSLNGQNFPDPATGETYNGGLNLVPGQAIYVYGPRYPGGRAINAAAFALPTSDTFGDAPRNFVRGFGATQVDFALRREFPIHENLRLQFRSEAFNVLNHPNFGAVDPLYGDVLFGQATATLSQSLGVLSPLYQTGGPRSMQLALKLTF
jgi:hypothetical protein